VKLNCFSGSAYAGGLEASQKLAEMSAAQHAIKDLDPTYTIVPLAQIIAAVNPGAQKPKAAGVAGVAGAVQPAAGSDPKSELNHFCQRHCKRPIAKGDIVFSCQKFGDQHQATVALNCISGAEYAGELRPNSKEAEKSAAEQALRAHAADIANLPSAATKRKAAATKPAGATTGGEMSGTIAQPAAKKAKTEGAAADAAANACITPKTQLNTLAMKIAKRALTKGETAYECLQVEGGYQATAQCSALPGEYATIVWAGNVCATKQAAEQSAAEIALAQLNSDPNVKPAESEKKSKGKGKGKEEFWEEFMAMMEAKGKGKGKFKKQSELPRTRVSEEDRTGKVISWKGNYGWIAPDVAIEHESAKKRDGKVYVNKKDLKEGSPEMGEGALITFKLFEDPSGVGAEEVFVTKEAPKTEKPAPATGGPKKEWAPAPKADPADKKTEKPAAAATKPAAPLKPFAPAPKAAP